MVLRQADLRAIRSLGPVDPAHRSIGLYNGVRSEARAHRCGPAVQSTNMHPNVMPRRTLL